jgi:hypothetical protein
MGRGGEGEGVLRSVVRDGSSPEASILEFIGTSFDVPGDDALSGFAMRRPPSDCERLKSFSMAQIAGGVT